MLPAAPPAATAYVIRRGARGWPAYAVQAALNQLDHADLVLDGVWGPATDRAVRAFQRAHRLTVDGIAGPASQGAMIAVLCALVDVEVQDVPQGLMCGYAAGEGANVLPAVNWSVAGGVDCGPPQLRCYGPPFKLAALEQAFDPLTALTKAARDFVTRRNRFLRRAWVAGSHERASRVATLAHNWPAGADYYADHGHAPSPTATATWVPPGIRFPDGAPVRTRQDWCEFYALGGRHGPGAITKYVTNWR